MDGLCPTVYHKMKDDMNELVKDVQSILEKLIVICTNELDEKQLACKKEQDVLTSLFQGDKLVLFTCFVLSIMFLLSVMWMKNRAQKRDE